MTHNNIIFCILTHPVKVYSTVTILTWFLALLSTIIKNDWHYHYCSHYLTVYPLISQPFHPLLYQHVHVYSVYCCGVHQQLYNILYVIEK